MTTIADALRRLAGAEVDCGCGQDGAPKGSQIQPDPGQSVLYKPHADCNGTGRVARIPTFRKPCSGPYGHYGPYTFQTMRLVSCREVGCPGWLPLDESEVHLEMVLETIGRGVVFYRSVSGVTWKVHIMAAGDGGPWARTSVEAAVLALDTMMREEKYG